MRHMLLFWGESLERVRVVRPYILQTKMLMGNKIWPKSILNVRSIDYGPADFVEMFGEH
jgi:hypothetical protein